MKHKSVVLVTCTYILFYPDYKFAEAEVVNPWQVTFFCHMIQFETDDVIAN
jgi:hypothetical protein